MPCNGTLEPDTARSRASRRRSLPGGNDHAARFTRRLASVLRKPLAAFSNVLALESNTSRTIGDDPERRIVFRVAARSFVAFCRLFVLGGWLAYATGHPELTLARATKQYVASMRRGGLKTSQSTLYNHSEAFDRRGLVGLLPKWKGGRPRRIPPAERALLKKVSRKINTYRIYCLIRKDAGLPGRPTSRSTVQRLAKEFSEQIAPNVRQRATQRRPSGGTKNRGTAFMDGK